MIVLREGVLWPFCFDAYLVTFLNINSGVIPMNPAGFPTFSRSESVKLIKVSSTFVEFPTKGVPISSFVPRILLCDKLLCPFGKRSIIDAQNQSLPIHAPYFKINDVVSDNMQSLFNVPQ